MPNLIIIQIFFFFAVTRRHFILSIWCKNSQYGNYHCALLCVIDANVSIVLSCVLALMPYDRTVRAVRTCVSRLSRTCA